VADPSSPIPTSATYNQLKPVPNYLQSANRYLYPGSCDFFTVYRRPSVAECTQFVLRGNVLLEPVRTATSS
jgi:hypothetical protein